MLLNSFHGRALPAFLLGAGLAGSAAGGTATISFSDTIPVTTTNWTDSVQLPKFDPALGTLLTVTVRLDGRIEGQAAVESLDTSPITIETRFQANIALARPDNTPLLAVIPQVINFSPLAPFDGVIDFMGPSGATLPNLMSTASDEATSPPPASDLVLFTGPGTITMPCVAQGLSVALGSGNVITQFATKAGATVTVTYTYNPPIVDCNNNQVEDAQDIATGTSQDCDHNGVPDECQPDCDTDGVPDVCELAAGHDCDHDGIPDDCDTPCPECVPTVGQKPASLLLYPLFDNRAANITLVTVTNTNCNFVPDGTGFPTGTVDVEFVYIGRWGINNVPLPCLETNRTRRLTPCDTITIWTATDNPNHERGYLYVFAKDPITHAAIVFNHLIGDEMIFSANESLEDALDAVPFLGIGPEGSNTDHDNDTIRDLDGVEYSPAPDELLIPRFLGQSLATTNGGGTYKSKLILIGLTGGISFTTTVNFLVYNDFEEEFSANWTFFCWDDPRLVTINNVFTEEFLDSTTNDPHEILGTEAGFPPTAQKEAGWFKVDGANAQSGFVFIEDPAVYAVLIERFGTYCVAALPYELCTQDNGDLLPKGPLGDQ